MTEHTPGPWSKGRGDMTTLSQRYPEEWVKHVYADSDRVGVHMGEALPMIVAAGYGIEHGEAHANACLVAAAPDMLALLKRSRSTFGDIERAEYDDLIARAEGRVA